MSVKPTADSDFLVYSFAADDPIVCKDYVRQRLGIPQWQPGKGYGWRAHSRLAAPSVVCIEPKGAAQSVEALIYDMRDRGELALRDRSNLHRIAELNPRQVEEVCARLAKRCPAKPDGVPPHVIAELARIKRR